jgi:cytosine/uracil/thiamine/allantoin permease
MIKAGILDYVKPPALVLEPEPSILLSRVTGAIATWILPFQTKGHGQQALPVIALGYSIIAVVMVLNGTIGARLRVSFPVLNRSSFGFWFSYFSVMVLAMVQFGVQTLPSQNYSQAN